LASIAANGIAAFTGDNLLNFQNGRDVIASVMAHEIGHNLGLSHTTTGGPNLMSPQGMTEQLTESQMLQVFSATSFPRPVPRILVGDYNNSGTVDAADFTVWRNTFGRSGSGLAADGNNNGTIDSGDYSVWKSNFGDTNGAGGSSLAETQTVPEPVIVWHLLVAFTILFPWRRSRSFA
jgi:hypothetical protein